MTEAQTVDVRSKIAADADVSPGTLDKVRKILESAAPNIREAVRAKEISIHKAWQWCQLSAHQQVKELEKYRSRKGINQTSRRLIQKHVAAATAYCPRGGYRIDEGEAVADTISGSCRSCT